METRKTGATEKVERGISFPDARKAALSEQSTNTLSKRTEKGNMRRFVHCYHTPKT